MTHNSYIYFLSYIQIFTSVKSTIVRRIPNINHVMTPRTLTRSLMLSQLPIDSKCKEENYRHIYLIYQTVLCIGQITFFIMSSVEMF